MSYKNGQNIIFRPPIPYLLFVLAYPLVQTCYQNYNLNSSAPKKGTMFNVYVYLFINNIFYGALSSLIIRVKLYLLLSFQGSNIFLLCTQRFINHFTTYLDMFCEKLLLFCCLKQTKPNIKFDSIFKWPSSRGVDFLSCVCIYVSYYQVSRLRYILISWLMKFILMWFVWILIFGNKFIVP